MNTAVVVMRDGRSFVGPLWDFQPKLGWLAIVDEAAPERIFLRNIQTALTNSEHLRGVSIAVDILARARELGWDGQ